MTPFIFVKHGDPDPVEWKRANPGWVSFPATFIPHKKPPPKWAIINGRRWPLDKRGQPWPRSRFGQPLCPLDEFPPGVPAPGTQGKRMEEEEAKLRETVALVRSGALTPEWFTAERLRGEADRAAREAANPTPPPQPSAYTYDPSAPSWAYLAQRAREPDVMRAAGEDARYQTATDAERREMPDAVLIRNGAPQHAVPQQAERRPAVLAAGSAVAASAGSVAVPATVLLALARTAAGLAQLVAAGLSVTPAGLAALAAAAATGATIYLLQQQHRSLVDQGALPAAPTDQARSTDYDVMGAVTGMPDPSWSGDEPRVLAPLPGFGDGPQAPPFQEEFSPAPAVPQSTATPAPERLIDPVESFQQATGSPATVFEQSRLRRNLEAAGRIKKGEVAHHTVPGGGPIDTGRDARRTQQKLEDLEIDRDSADNGVALSPEFHGQIHKKSITNI